MSISPSTRPYLVNMPKTSPNISKPKPQGATRMGTQGTILQGVDMRTHGGRGALRHNFPIVIDHTDRNFFE
jgi:hypothetical protein